jgi:1-aminocyclopropane-1-carboxylate deaminase/D-cysteine desulfhydrase-like pyridoxal-dependent ACC family enzyme
MLGVGVAVCCREFPDLRSIVSFPMGKADSSPPPAAKRARVLGAELLAVPAARINICLAAARRHVEERGGRMLPFGLDCPEAVAAVAQEAARTDPACYRGGTVVLSCGSGVTLAGLLNGLAAKPNQIIGVSSGRSCENILRCVLRYSRDIPDFVNLRQPAVPYSAALSYPCPFPCNAYYDLKAWKFLAENIRRLPSPILFWNIGA